MVEKIKLFIENISAGIECAEGSDLFTLSQQVDTGCRTAVLAAVVDNQLKELSYVPNVPHRVRFLDYSDVNGRRTYFRSICFVLQKAVSEFYPEFSLELDYSLPNGLYAAIYDKTSGQQEIVEITTDDIVRIKRRMEEIIRADYPITRQKIESEKAVALFREHGRYEKAALVESLGQFYVSVYFLDGYADTFYGPLVYSTGVLDQFDLIPYGEGFCIHLPDNNNRMDGKYKYQDKLYAIFKENAGWCNIMGVSSIASVNNIILKGRTTAMIQIAEALHERKYADIADAVYRRKDKVKMVLISGPSSSGKTTTSKRIALQCKVLGMNPVVVAMDNYFVNREDTPLDENGEYDYESIHALDLPFLNQQMNDMFQGKEVELPKFDFKKGCRYFDGETIRLKEKDILVMEGIHALNPLLTSDIDPERIFRVYASALTSLSIDENNYISTSDSRLIRRMVRDYNSRGVTPEETIMRWASVRRGEERNIFPYQENADVMFNSTLVYELPLLKYFAEPLLSRIMPSSPAYTEAVRLRKFLAYTVALHPAEIRFIPPTSVMREFIGGSSFEY